MRVAVIGAGPIGLEAAAEAAARGHEVVVYERGHVGEHVRRWGHVRLFTPWSMAATPRGIARAGIELTNPDACPTGDELVSGYLLPLAATLEVREGTEVVAVSRARRRKGDAIGHRARTEEPFRLVLRDAEGERVDRADAVLDCTGVFGDPGPAGLGGVPAPGETEAVAAGRVRHGPVPVADLAGQRVALVGDGASGVTVLGELLGLTPAPQIHWITPAAEVPGFVSPDNDPLPSRRALYELGREAPAHERVTHHPAALVEAMRVVDDGVELELTDGSSVAVDAVVAATGFRPDHGLTRELQLHLCYASEGPMKLAAALLAASGGGGDCLDQPAQGAETLANPEPRFYVLGNKSYGRRSDFLLQVGHRQVVDALDLLEA